MNLEEYFTMLQKMAAREQRQDKLKKTRKNQSATYNNPFTDR